MKFSRTPMTSALLACIATPVALAATFEVNGVASMDTAAVIAGENRELDVSGVMTSLSITGTVLTAAEYPASLSIQPSLPTYTGRHAVAARISADVASLNVSGQVLFEPGLAYFDGVDTYDRVGMFLVGPGVTVHDLNISGTVDATGGSGLRMAHALSLVGSNITHLEVEQGAIIRSDEYGVEVRSNRDADNNLLNSASITQLVNQGFIYGLDTGLDVGDDAVVTELVNHGTIRGFEEYGVDVRAGLVRFTNTGVIESGSKAIRHDRPVTGAWNNSGTIRSTIEFDDDNNVFTALELGDGLDGAGDFVNTGLISVDGSRAYSGVTSRGLEIGIGATNGISLVGSSAVTNAAGGIIRVETNSIGTATSFGIDLVGGLADLTNVTNQAGASISVAAHATGDFGGAKAYGIFVDRGLAAGTSINNAGVIDVESSTLSADSSFSSRNAQSFGLWVDDEIASGASVVNSGVIRGRTVPGNGVVDGSLIHFRNVLNGTLTNSGTLDSENLAYAIYAQGGEGTVINQATGDVRGRVWLNSFDNTAFSGTANTTTLDMTNQGRLWLTRNQESYVSGAYSQPRDGKLQLDITSSAETGGYSRITVDGDANLADETQVQLNLASNNTLSADDRIEGVIRAGSLVNGDNTSTFRVTDNSVMLGFAAERNSTQSSWVDLVVSQDQTFNETIAQANVVGLAPVATAIDSGTSAVRAATQPIQARSTAASVADATTTLLPSHSGENFETVTAMTGQLSRLMLERVDLLGGAIGLSSGDTLGDDVWVEAFGSRLDVNARKGLPGYDGKTHGLALGIERSLSATSSVGFSLSLGDIETRAQLSEGAQVLNGRLTQLSAYGQERLADERFFNWQVGYGVTQYESSRALFDASTATANFSGSALTGRFELGQRFKVDGDSTISPFVLADVGFHGNDGYTESGTSPLRLTVQPSDQTNAAFGIGVRSAYAPNNEWLFESRVEVAQTMSEDGSTSAQFAGGGDQFVIEPASLGDTAFGLGLGVKYNQSETVEWALNYSAEGRRDSLDQSLKLQWRTVF